MGTGIDLRLLSDRRKKMTETALNNLVTAAKLRLRLKTNAFDEEVKDLINAAAMDLLKRNAVQEAQLNEDPLDPLILRAIMTFVRANFGEPENPERLKADYDEQKATLMMTSGYTVWEES